ncbi:thioredoxin-like protein [Scheffersomyces xylosifermentans]|uniref:thioredoxin-like protein n=1 Tax=Scheffersomyces xylosifermentans TaxID=1304137 RepID=UPI00315C91CA
MPVKSTNSATGNDKMGEIQNEESHFYSYRLLTSSNEPVDFSKFKGKVVIVVNVASLCGFTPQYKDFEYLFQKYKDQGLEIIGFPCNQFGHQEPSEDAEIALYCQRNYGVTFPIMKKVIVNGDDEAPIYTWLKNQKRGAVGFKGLRWNFEKFIIDKKGNVVARFLSTATPLDFENYLVKLLKQ